MVKTNGTLTAPFKMPEKYGKGTPIRHTVHTHHQPFLLMCNNTHKDYAVSVPSSINRSLVTNAYVDITVFITRDGGSKHQGLWCTIRSNIKRAEVNWTSRRPMEKLNAPPVRISIERTRREVSRCLPRQQQNWTLLETKVRAMGESPTSYFLSRTKQIPNKTVGSKLTRVPTVLPPPKAFLDTMQRLMASFIWQGRHWKQPNLCMGDW
jgi:hypothetical protein